MGPGPVAGLVAKAGLQPGFVLEDVFIDSGLEVLGVEGSDDDPVAEEAHVEQLAGLGQTLRPAGPALEFGVEPLDRPPPLRGRIGRREPPGSVGPPADGALGRGIEIRRAQQRFALGRRRDSRTGAKVLPRNRAAAATKAARLRN